MAGISPTPPMPALAYAKRRRAAVVAILTVVVAALTCVSHIMADRPSTAAVMCLAWFSASIAYSNWNMFNERCRNLEQAQ